MATPRSKESESKLRKTKPTIFPLGFTVYVVEDNVTVVDFIDILEGKSTIVESIALPLAKAEQLSKALSDAIEHAKPGI